ncbi:MAG: amidase [Proteobacteria bacterium]|jgi:amidase|nr:amidase [Pseudomonadota bacterium]
MDELAFCDASTLARKIRSGECSSLGLLEHYIDRMARYNPEINAIICHRLDWARERATQADAALARGENWGPLHGVPMTVKESYNLTGLPTTWGVPAQRDNVADHDAVACERLQSAGAVIFGKTNVPISLADFQSYNEIYGTTGNPHDLSRTPGGSSGGSAAALAAGMTGLEMGSDIGGSIRNPAHYCGVFGHKPTWGILPMRGHALPGILTMSDISVIGPLARSATDLDLVLDIVGGADELHRPGWDLNLPPAQQKSLADFKVAVWLDDQRAPVDESVRKRVARVADCVAEAGGQVDYEARPEFDIDAAMAAYESLLQSVMTARQPDEVFEKALQRSVALAPDDTSALARSVRSTTLYYREWHRFNEQRTHLRWAWHRFFKHYDVLLTPMCVTSAFAHDHRPWGEREVLVNNELRPYSEQIFWAGLSGVAYLPSTVFPTGPDEHGLPIGVHAVGPEMGDRTTIAFARMVHDELGGFVAAPRFKD